jgi:hypothetical protein
MYDLEKYHPIQMDDLVRVGCDFDGGYVLTKRQIEKTEILLGFGIGENWSFEQDFLQKRKGVKLYAFDESVSLLKLKHESLWEFGYMLVYLFLGRISKSQNSKNQWHYYAKKAKEFASFFSDSQNHFFEKYLGEYDHGGYTCFDTIFKDILSSPSNTIIKDHSIFIKMDIENWEYRTLPQLLPYFEKINGLVIEFHELDIAAKKFEEIMDMFSSQFYIAHVHANLCGGYIYNTKLPMLLEITLIHKSLVGNVPALSTLDYPVKGLDQPNAKDNEDIVLPFLK